MTVSQGLLLLRVVSTRSLPDKQRPVVLAYSLTRPPTSQECSRSYRSGPQSGQLHRQSVKQITYRIVRVQGRSTYFAILPVYPVQRFSNILFASHGLQRHPDGLMTSGDIAFDSHVQRFCVAEYRRLGGNLNDQFTIGSAISLGYMC